MSDDIYKDNMERIHQNALSRPLDRQFYLYYKVPDLECQLLAYLKMVDNSLLELFGLNSDMQRERHALYEKIREDIKLLCEL